MADASIQTRARETAHFAAALRELAELLPDDDAALETALLEAIGDRDEDGFAHMLLAALDAGRKVDGRILADGAALLPPVEMIMTPVVHCTGDVGGALLDAIHGGRLDAAYEALALALCAWWSRERGGCEIPADAISHARVLARGPWQPFSIEMLVVFNDFADDVHLAELLFDKAPKYVAEKARELFNLALDRAHEDPLFCVPVERPPTELSGYTVRRAVARVGRNDPCPCGSEKKYKRCCFKQDRERLRHSSDVEGVTVEELRRNPEPYITLERLDAMSSSELTRIDATRIDPALLVPLVHGLTRSHEFDAVVKLFETTVKGSELDDYLMDAIEEAADLGQADTVKRLLAVVGGEQDDLLGRLRLRARIMAEGLEPGPFMQRIESVALDQLDEEHGPLELAHALLGGPSPALGILIARGALWAASEFDSWALLQTLLETRDRLGLSPADLAEDLVDEQRRVEDDDRESGKFVSDSEEEARRELDAKLVEARTLRADLRDRDRALRQLEARMKEFEARDGLERAEEAKTRAIEPSANEESIKELRRRLAEHKGELKRKHDERNELRAELRRTRHEAESLRARTLDVAKHGDSGAEREETEDESLLLPEESAGEQPPRLPRFRRQFGDDLQRVPISVARAALRLIGRIAAGESAAFRGARRLSVNREVWRLRVGLGHRLLFRTGKDDALVVLCLVTRQDFPRVVRSL